MIILYSKERLSGQRGTVLHVLVLYGKRRAALAEIRGFDIIDLEPISKAFFLLSFRACRGIRLSLSYLCRIPRKARNDKEAFEIGSATE
jgi:hypothetical protein